MRITTLIAIGFVLFASLQLTFAQRSGIPQSGEAVDDLQMAISETGLIKTGVPNLQAVFQNIGDRDITVLLGIIGGSSPRPCKLDSRNIPCTLNFKLNVTDSRSTTRTYEFRGIIYVFGRIDPYVIYLRAHSTYTLELGVDQFWSPATHEYEALSFAPGSYKLSLEFEGRAPGHINLDQPNLAKATFWKGKLTSNSLSISVARGAQPNKSLDRSAERVFLRMDWGSDFLDDVQHAIDRLCEYPFAGETVALIGN